jgi:hypothetical protein
VIGVGARVSGTFDALGIRREVDMMARRTVQTGARTGAQAARRVASQRVQSGGMAAIVVVPAQEVPGFGWRAAFISPRKHAWHQEYGTLGSRTKALKSAPRTARTRAPGTGVKPLGFLRVGLRVGAVAMTRQR